MYRSKKSGRIFVPYLINPYPDKMKSILFIAFGFSFLINELVAQYNSAISSPHQVGVNFGFCTGTGLTYRYWPHKFGVQATLIGMKGESTTTYNNGLTTTTESIVKQYISIGLTGICTLKELEGYKLITYVGNHLILLKNKEIYNTGIGIGICTNQPVSFSLLFGYGIYDLLGDINYLPTAEIGLVYSLPRRQSKINLSVPSP
jgi:hypothetical protein